MKKQQSFKAQELHGHKKITVELWGDKRLVWNNQNWEKNKTITIVRKQNRDHLKGRTFSREKVAKKWNYVEYVLIWHQTTTLLNHTNVCNVSLPLSFDKNKHRVSESSSSGSLIVGESSSLHAPQRKTNFGKYFPLQKC